MSLAIDAVQPFTVRGLIALSGRTAGMTVPDLLGRERRLGFYLDFDDTNETIEIDFREAEVVAAAMAADSCRFACAAFQSIAPVTNEIVEKQTLAWALIKLYYAAFYAGHAIIRLLGESCSYFDRNHVSRITQLGLIYGRSPTFRIDSGLYQCVTDSTASTLKCRQVRGGSGGAHELFWSVFGARIQRLNEDIMRGTLSPIEAQSVFAKFDALLRSIRSRGAPMCSWLSLVRNDLQYRHQFGVWFPATLRKREREQLSRLANQWSRDPMGIDLGLARAGPLGEFVATCVFIVALCRSMLIRIAERSTAGTKSFACFGPISFLQDAGLMG